MADLGAFTMWNFSWAPEFPPERVDDDLQALLVGYSQPPQPQGPVDIPKARFIFVQERREIFGGQIK